MQTPYELRKNGSEPNLWRKYLKKPLAVSSLVSTFSRHTHLQAPGGNREIETIRMEERRKEVK